MALVKPGKQRPNIENVVEKVLDEQKSDIATAFLEPACVVTTRDVSTQCSKLNKKYITVITGVKL